MVIFIYLCILVLNLAAIFMTYKFLGDEIEQKERAVFIIVGIAIMYACVSFVYWLSTKGMDMQNVSEAGKNFITFTFVPINSMVALPFLGRSYRYLKEGRLKTTVFRNRFVLVAVILLIVLIIEFFYFKNIQDGILSIIQVVE